MKGKDFGVVGVISIAWCKIQPVKGLKLLPLRLTPDVLISLRGSSEMGNMPCVCKFFIGLLEI